MTPVDIDDPATWPPDVHEMVEPFAARLAGRPPYTSDLPISPEEDEKFRSLLSGAPILAFHATRLLDHEVESVRREGLALSSPELVSSRISDAWEAGYLTDREREELTTSNLYAIDHQVDIREGRVCLFLSRGVMEHSVNGIWHPLTNWGGEVIYFSSRFPEDVKERLKIIGQPAIVAVAIDITAPAPRRHLIFPGLLRSFVARVLGFEDYAGDIHYFSAIPAGQILDIWIPDHSEYNEYPSLPDGSSQR